MLLKILRVAAATVNALLASLALLIATPQLFGWLAALALGWQIGRAAMASTMSIEKFIQQRSRT